MARTIRSRRRALRPRSSCSPRSTPMRAEKIRGCGRCRYSLGAILAGGGDHAPRWREPIATCGRWCALNVSVIAGQGDRQESGSKRLWRPRGAIGRFIETRALA
ncbi:MAG: hypothetical protein MZV49_14420 [Rhodopseudomonas palustris]|nr:hypothetical protein [Rhodopseudomonas palustris]